MNNQNHNAVPLNATCPACGLLCDDVTLSLTPELSLQNGCTKGIHFFEDAFNTSASASPLLAGKSTNLETAINAAAEILANSKQALFAGLGTEVQGMRNIMSLAKKTNATLDHIHSESTVSNTRTMQNSGWLTTTLAEVKNRADVILAIGTDITSTHPRFFEKLAWNTDSLFDKPSPELIFLGAPEASAKENAAPDGKEPTIIPAKITQLPEVINALNSLLNGKKINVETVAGIPTNTLISLIEKLRTAKYAVIVWSASALKIPHAELTIQSIVQLISKLNENSRAAGLPLNSGDGDSSVNNVSTWLSGYPTRSRFNNGIPVYDTYHFATAKQLASCDALLWISTFNPYPAPNTQAPVIVIGHPDTKFERMPDVFIPVGIPGVDHNGQMFRMDSSITLPLKKLRDTNLPGLSEVIGKIEAKLSNRMIDGTAA
jgi:formylmethanofuran dehydrogenase subunit B